MRHSSLAAALLALAALPAHAQTAAGTVTLIGRVMDDARCVPLAGATVRAAGRAPVTTGADGRFRLAGLSDGPLALDATRAGYATAADTVALRAPALGYAELRLRAGGGDAPAEGGAAADAPRVTTTPERVTEGALFRLRVAAPGGVPARLAGELAGRRLHFTRAADGTHEALAAAPLEAADTLALVVGAARADGTRDPRARPWRIALPVARGDYPLERLRVAPEFGREPDPALAERLERESERARDVGCRAHLTPRLWEAPFARPRPGRVTSPFGRGREYNGTVTSRHTGTDFAGAAGAPVRAANRGVVRLTSRFYLGGNVVYLDHGEGLVSAYMHLSRTLVAEGDTVARGQTIGHVGSTGRVTGPHLHWVVRYGTSSVDPLSLLAVSAAGAPGAARSAREDAGSR
jgi:murein DD-endopeptidase MepM/ murein hydrolase activator NlpD